MIENLIAAWRIIFDRHPESEEIMDHIVDAERRVTVGQFEKWYAEALEA